MHFRNNTISKVLLTVFDIEAMQNPCHMFRVRYRLVFQILKIILLKFLVQKCRKLSKTIKMCQKRPHGSARLRP